MGSGQFSASTKAPIMTIPKLVATSFATPLSEGSDEETGRPATTSDEIRAEKDPIRQVILREKHNREMILDKLTQEIARHRIALEDLLDRKARLEAEVVKYASFLSNQGGED